MAAVVVLSLLKGSKAAVSPLNNDDYITGSTSTKYGTQLWPLYSQVSWIGTG